MPPMCQARPHCARAPPGSEAGAPPAESAPASGLRGVAGRLRLPHRRRGHRSPQPHGQLAPRPQPCLPELSRSINAPASGHPVLTTPDPVSIARSPTTTVPCRSGCTVTSGRLTRRPSWSVSATTGSHPDGRGDSGRTGISRDLALSPACCSMRPRHGSEGACRYSRPCGQAPMVVFLE